MKEINPTESIFSKIECTNDEIGIHRKKLSELDKTIQGIKDYIVISEKEIIEKMSSNKKDISNTNENVGKLYVMFGRNKDEVYNLEERHINLSNMTFDILTSLMVGLSKVGKMLSAMKWVFIILMLIQFGLAFLREIQGYLDIGLFCSGAVCAIIAIVMSLMSNILLDMIDRSRRRMKEYILSKDKNGEDNGKL